MIAPIMRASNQTRCKRCGPRGSAIGTSLKRQAEARENGPRREKKERPGEKDMDPKQPWSRGVDVVQRTGAYLAVVEKLLNNLEFTCPTGTPP